MGRHGVEQRRALMRTVMVTSLNAPADRSFNGPFVTLLLGNSASASVVMALVREVLLCRTAG